SRPVLSWSRFLRVVPGPGGARPSDAEPFTQEVPSGSSQVTVGPLVPRILTRLIVVFGRTLAPIWSTFFDSWLSAARAAPFNRPCRTGGAVRGMPNRASPLEGSYSDAPSSTLFRYSITSESGSTPEPRSVTGAPSSGRPAVTRFVSSLNLGGVRSFTHERSTYAPARERPVKTSRPESTATCERFSRGKTAPATPTSSRYSLVSTFALTGVAAYPRTSFSSPEPSNHASTNDPRRADTT